MSKIPERKRNVIPRATDEDYEAFQDGRPTKKVKGNLTTYTHDYPGGEGMEVTSHIDHGTVNLNTPDGVKEFNVDELKKFHGDPCEGASRKVGGRGYDRKSGPET